MVVVAMLVQPVAVFVPVTVYDVVLLSVTVSGFDVDPPGDHTYVFAPEAVNIAELPAHIVERFGVIVTDGSGFTKTVVVAVAEQLLAFVTVTV